ncbi:hypothetical protein ACVPOR_14300 [Staphylococcus aureus]
MEQKNGNWQHGYNIGTGTFTNLLEVYRIIGELYGNQSSMNLKKHERRY